MECYHEISYSHLSFKALEYLSKEYGLKLIRIAPVKTFGITYQLGVLLHPIPFKWGSKVFSSLIRVWLKLKYHAALPVILFRRNLSFREALELIRQAYKVDIYRMTAGYTFTIEKQI